VFRLKIVQGNKIGVRIPLELNKAVAFWQYQSMWRDRFPLGPSKAVAFWQYQSMWQSLNLLQWLNYSKIA